MKHDATLVFARLSCNASGHRFFDGRPVGFRRVTGPMRWHGLCTSFQMTMLIMASIKTKGDTP
jgi:hypothetical protein